MNYADQSGSRYHSVYLENCSTRTRIYSFPLIWGMVLIYLAVFCPSMILHTTVALKSCLFCSPFYTVHIFTCTYENCRQSRQLLLKSIFFLSSLKVHQIWLICKHFLLICWKVLLYSHKNLISDWFFSLFYWCKR